MKTKRKPAKRLPPLTWGRASKKKHKILGHFRRWRSRGGAFRVDQYVESSGVFIARVFDGCCWQLVGSRRTLKAAQRDCTNWQRKGGRS